MSILMEIYLVLFMIAGICCQSCLKLSYPLLPGRKILRQCLIQIGIDLRWCFLYFVTPPLLSNSFCILIRWACIALAFVYILLRLVFLLYIYIYIHYLYFLIVLLSYTSIWFVSILLNFYSHMLPLPPLNPYRPVWINGNVRRVKQS